MPRDIYNPADDAETVGIAHTASLFDAVISYCRGKKYSRKGDKKIQRKKPQGGCIQRRFEFDLFVWFLFICFLFLFMFLFLIVSLMSCIFSNTNDRIADMGNFMRDDPFGLPCMHEGSASVASLWSLCCYLHFSTDRGVELSSFRLRSDIEGGFRPALVVSWYAVMISWPGLHNEYRFVLRAWWYEGWQRKTKRDGMVVGEEDERGQTCENVQISKRIAP